MNKSLKITSKKELFPIFVEGKKALGRFVNQDVTEKASFRILSETFQSLESHGFESTKNVGQEKREIVHVERAESSDRSIDLSKPAQAKSLFGCEDIFQEIIKRLYFSELLILRLVTKVTEKFIADKLRVVLIDDDLFSVFMRNTSNKMYRLCLKDTSEKLKFAQEKDHKIIVKVENYRNVEHLINIIKSSDHQDILNCIEAIKFGDIKIALVADKVQVLLDLIATKSHKVTSLSFGDIKNTTLTFPSGLDNLSSCSFGHIFQDATITFPKQLNSLSTFYCGGMSGNATLLFPEKLNRLTSCYFKDIELKENATPTIEFPKEFYNLTLLSFQNVKNPDIEQMFRKIQATIEVRAKDKTNKG